MQTRARNKNLRRDLSHLAQNPMARVMKLATFAPVRDWVFDLDNTLYPPHMRLFDQIEARMTAFIVRTLGVSPEEADDMRGRYWRQYGTTLAGLMREHDLDPDPYLEDVHRISFDVLTPDPALAAAIAALPGRAIIYTNGTARYARHVLAARGLDGLFDAVYGVENAGYLPKPEAQAFAHVFAQANLDTQNAAMFEDDARNLMVPHALGMRTVHVSHEITKADHVHHQTDDLTAFLQHLVAA